MIGLDLTRDDGLALKFHEFSSREPRGWIRGVLEQYVAGGACPEPLEGTPEDARKDGHIRGRSRQFVKYQG
jgi:hypothetical protein